MPLKGYTTRSKPESIYLDNSYIPFPKTNCNYYLKSNAVPYGKVKITFQGDGIEDYILFDAKTLTLKSKKYSDKYINLSSPGSFYIVREALPLYLLNEDLPPVLVYTHYHPNVLAGVSSFNIYANLFENTLDDKLFKVCNIAIENSKIFTEYSNEVKDMQVHCGSYPIFFEAYRPTFSFLQALFEQFIEYNTEENLQQQTANTPRFCAIRAHFVSTLLTQYGIPHLKIIKYWDIAQWETFSTDVRWTFHMAVVVHDDQNAKWIWDPWEGSHQKLLNLNQWLYADNHPRPYKLMITNRAIVTNVVHGLDFFADGADFMRSPLIHPANFNSFQFMYGHAVPNHPEFPVATAAQQYGFFTSKKVQVKELNDTQSATATRPMAFKRTTLPV